MGHQCHPISDNIIDEFLLGLERYASEVKFVKILSRQFGEKASMTTIRRDSDIMTFEMSNNNFGGYREIW